MAFRVGILGMGRIAAGFDMPGDRAIRTHIKAIEAEPRLELVCVADTDEAHAARELARFSSNAEVVSIAAILKSDLDVLCIASPDGTHLDYVEKAADGSIPLVFVEKPLEANSDRRRCALATLEKRSATLAVHHLRRWIPGLTKWIAEAKSGGFGKPISVTVHYSRGFRHNGVHALDLIAAFIGENPVEVRPVGSDILDFSEDDPTRSLLLHIDGGGKTVPVLLIGVDGRSQTVFDVDIRFDAGRVHIFDEGGVRATLFRPAAIDVPGFAPEFVTAEQFHDTPTRLLATVWENIAGHLQGETTLACSGTDAFAAYDLADRILDRLPR